MICAKMAEPIEMLFGGQTSFGRMNLGIYNAVVCHRFKLHAAFLCCLLCDTAVTCICFFFLLKRVFPVLK